MKKRQEDEALMILSKVYKDKDRAQSQLREIKSAVNSRKEPFLETLKFVMRWKNLQRYHNHGSYIDVNMSFCPCSRLLIGFFILFLGTATGGIFIT